ncbi:C39 family peptidase [Patescibacteria group bacterium]|nr:C39 family peptidase [Patescibacteria group bacterium]
MNRLLLIFFLAGISAIYIFSQNLIIAGETDLLVDYSAPPRIAKTTVKLVTEYVNLFVPFTSQAPLEIWDDLHKEACEEAAVLQVASFWQNISSLTSQEAEEQLQSIVDFELNQYGFFEDTNAAQTADLINDYYQFSQTDVYYDISIEEIKEELAAGFPVIVPTAGRQLLNPYFQVPGPLYHMLVIRGYQENEFITNDNGTKRGEQYLYDQELLWSAIHDFNQGDTENGRKAMIVIRP